MANRIITSAMLDQIRLEHHGVKGMKWGVRRTPEQLGRRTKSAKKSAIDSDTKVGSFEAYLISLGLTLAVGAVTTIVAKGQTKKAVKKASSDELKITKLSDVKRIQPPEDFLASMKSVNDTSSISAYYTMNCPNTTLAYEFRRRGYDVQAKPSPAGQSMSQIQKAYNIETPDLSINNLSNAIGNRSARLPYLTDYFDKAPDNFRGAVVVSWMSGGGHIFNAEKVGGKTYLVDAQSGRYGEVNKRSIRASAFADTMKTVAVGTRSKDPVSYLSRARSIDVLRIDNAKVDESFLGDQLLKRGV